MEFWYWVKKFKLKLKAVMGNDIYAYRYQYMFNTYLLYTSISFPFSKTKQNICNSAVSATALGIDPNP